MNFWKQLPNPTKIYLVILLYLVFLLCGLLLLRQGKSSSGGFSFAKIFTNRENKNLTLTPAATEILPTATFSPGTAWLRSKTNAQVHDGPGDEYAAIAWLENDQVSEIIGVSEDRRWWVIPLPYFSKGKGWVSAEQVEVNNISRVPVLGPEGEDISITATPESRAKVRAVANINIRQGPDLRYQKIGTLENGQSADIVGISADSLWYLIKVPGTTNVQGWIARDYVVTENAEDVAIVSSDSGSQSTLAPGSPYLLAKVTVNVRSGPDTTFALVGQLNQGQIAEIVGKSSDGAWWAIQLPGSKNTQGWVAAAYVDAKNTNDVPVIK
jgi:uncharacterized protein YraI